MNRFLTKMEIRWNDLDANRHVANASYVAFMTHVRMQYLSSKGIDSAFFESHKMGPVILKEDYHFLKEIHPLETVHIDVELLGLSEDGKLTKFSHCLFNQDGKLAAYSTLLFVWMDLDTRKMILPPPVLKQAIEALPKAAGFAPLTRADLLMKEVPRNRKLDLSSLD